MTDQRIKRLQTKLEASRARLRKILGEISKPLYDMIFVATYDLKRISTNGYCIYFNPDWLQKLKDESIDFMLAHVLMHIQLMHIERSIYFNGDRFHLACDIIANANLEVLGLGYDRLPQVGTIFKETFYPRIFGLELMPKEAFAYVPFDPSEMTMAKERNFMIDSDAWWDKKDDRGEKGVIISLGEDKDETVYEINLERKMFWSRVPKHREAIKRLSGESDGCKNVNGENFSQDSDGFVKQKIKSLRDARKKEQTFDDINDFTERLWQKGQTQNLNWRQILNAFIQEEMYDYTFSPPDKRFSNTEFFLPDYNITDYERRKVLFMVDTSGSVDDEAIRKVYAEIYSSILQFDGALSGFLCFFDTMVYGEIPIAGINDLYKAIPKGNGGTDYSCVFAYANRLKEREKIADIIIFTDGKAAFPQMNVAGNTPVLWIFSDNKIQAPWGKCAWITK